MPPREKERPYVQSVSVILFICICLWGIVEVFAGVLQVFGLRESPHALFALTGLFRNPGPYGCFLACVSTVAGSWLLAYPSSCRNTGLLRGMAGLAKLSFALCLIILPATMSRVAWLALVLALGVEALHRSDVREWLGKRKKWLPFYGIGCVMAVIGGYLIKPESALGRFHIWRMELLALGIHPWTGVGAGKATWAYGEAQELFFRKHLDSVSPATIRIAGCPEYAFNEYLGIGIEYGIPAMAIFIALLISAILVFNDGFRHFGAGLTAWSVIAITSYPLSVSQLQLMLFCLICAAVALGILRLLCIGYSFKSLMPSLAVVLLFVWVVFIGGHKPWTVDKDEFRILFAEGYYLHQEGRFAESTLVLEQGAQMSSDPMFEVIMGKNAEAVGDYERAEGLYKRAHFRVPSRLYPLVRLMRLQIRLGRNTEALETARLIVGMPVNERHEGMVRLYEETRMTLDSLENVCSDGQGKE